MDKQKRPKIYSDVTRLTMEEVPWTFAYQQIDLYGMIHQKLMPVSMPLGHMLITKKWLKGKKILLKAL